MKLFLIVIVSIIGGAAGFIIAGLIIRALAIILLNTINSIIK